MNNHRRPNRPEDRRSNRSNPHPNPRGDCIYKDDGILDIHNVISFTAFLCIFPQSFPFTKNGLAGFFTHLMDATYAHLNWSEGEFWIEEVADMILVLMAAAKSKHAENRLEDLTIDIVKAVAWMGATTCVEHTNFYPHYVVQGIVEYLVGKFGPADQAAAYANRLFRALIANSEAAALEVQDIGNGTDIHNDSEDSDDSEESNEVEVIDLTGDSDSDMSE